MLAFRDKPVTALQVGQQLGAAYVLEGSIRRAGNRVRITAQLVEVSTRHSVWAERYDRLLEDVFAIQEEIARSIAQALRITLTPQEEKTIARKPTENPQAYDFYLRGRSYTRRGNLDYGLQMFEQAIQLDPNFALAHGGIAQLCGRIYETREQNPKWIERALAACDRATALAPDLPEVLIAHARICYAQKKYEEAALLAQRAIERKPDCEGSWNLLGRAYFASGHGGSGGKRPAPAGGRRPSPQRRQYSLQCRLHLRRPWEKSRGARDAQEGVCGRIRPPGLGGQGFRSRLPARQP